MTPIITVDDGFSPNKPGLYDVTYTVTDADGATTSATKQVYVYSEAKYASDMAWTSATASWGSVTKDKSVQNEAIKLLIDNETKVFKKAECAGSIIGFFIHERMMLLLYINRSNKKGRSSCKPTPSRQPSFNSI